MKAATVVQLKKELETLDPEHLKTLCLRLARFKLENKELLTYLLFESEDEAYYIEGIKETADLLFEEINTKSYFYIKKSVRKILRMLKKHARYSNKKETEIELLLYYCYKLKTFKPSINNNVTLTNIYLRQVESIEKKIIKLKIYLMQILGIDIGGTGMKGAIVDSETGDLLSERLRVPTPKPATPESVANELKTLIDSFEWNGPVGISFPTVIKNGKAMQYGNLDKSWQFTQVDELFKSKTGNDFYIVNDADAAAMGVMEFGIGKNQMGLVITITLGTGIGSGVFFNGQLLSNFELGRMYGRKGDIMELFAADSARKREDWSFKTWGKRVNFFLKHVENTFNPDLIIIGGGVSKKMDKFKPYIDIQTPIKAAELKNNAGIIGAAIFAKKNC
jgi:polyphosphate glucokinase